MGPNNVILELIRPKDKIIVKDKYKMFHICGDAVALPRTDRGTADIA